MVAIKKTTSKIKRVALPMYFQSVPNEVASAVRASSKSEASWSEKVEYFGTNTAMLVKSKDKAIAPDPIVLFSKK